MAQDPTKLHGIIDCLSALKARLTGRSASTTKVHVKWTTEETRRLELRYEAFVYVHQLQPLQGMRVPRFFGYYEGLRHGKVLAISVFQDGFWGA